tara:strand:+ start:3223 stop:3924 length:702 start_codon:yes stop_codon:yes gene_type:complete
MNEETTKKLCLKVLYGGHLTAEEKLVWEAYQQTDSGQTFTKESSEMKNFLDDMATVELAPDPPADLKMRFESLIKAQIDKSRTGWMGLAFWIAPTMTVLVALIASWSYLTMGWFDQLPLLLFFTICMGLASLIGIHCRETISAQTDLAGYMKDNHRRAKNLSSRVATVFLVLAVPLAGGIMEYFRVGWERGILAFIMMLVIFGCNMMFIWCRRQALRRSDPEAWQWWDQELKD